MMNNKDLAELMAQNPDLPVVAMVNGDICHDYGMCWMGRFTAVSVQWVGLVGERMYDDRESFIEAYYNSHDDELCEMFDYLPLCCTATVETGKYTQEQFAANCLAEEKLNAYLDERANEYMKKCIVVYVDEPDLSEWKEAE